MEEIDPGCVKTFSRTIAAQKTSKLGVSSDFQPSQLGKLPQISCSRVSLEIERAFLHSLGPKLPLRDDNNRPGDEIKAAPTIAPVAGANTAPENFDFALAQDRPRAGNALQS